MTNDTLDTLLSAFRGILREAWPHAERASRSSRYDGVLADWMQATWECVVESGLVTDHRIYLEVYGEGADLNDRSSRVYLPSQLPTHRVVCTPREGTEFFDELNGEPFSSSHALPLEEFVSLSEGWYRRAPPFDCVLFEDAPTERVVRVESVEFHLEAISDSKDAPEAP